MFHAGDLNSGILLAIQEQKLVACFVRSDEDEWSSTWEEQWLSEEDNEAEASGSGTLGQRIGEKAVLLRIDFGSREASFLAAFCPITKAPTLVVIQSGQVLEKLEGGLSQEEWKTRLMNSVGLEDAQHTQKKAADGEQPITQGSTEAPATDEEVTHVPQSEPEDSHTATSEAPSTSRSPPLPPAPTQSQPHVQTLLQERAQRLAIEKQKREAAEQAERTARATARRKEAEEAHAAHRPDKGKQRATEEGGTEKEQKARRDWIYQQKLRKDEAKRERERILNQIEADKQERRARAQRTKDAETATSGSGASEPMRDAVSASSRRTAGAGGACSLQIRLFDGSSIRHRFSTDATLATSVRSWIAEASPPGSGGADIPYNFRQILAPQPSRSIEVSEEHQTLADLELIPNATLVLVPVAGYTDAYGSSSSSAAGVFGWAQGWYNSMPRVSYFLPSFSSLYMGGTGDAQEASNVEGAAAAGADNTSGDAGTAKLRVKTLADQREEAAKRNPEFYNGNSIGVQGRKDENGDEGGEDKRR